MPSPAGRASCHRPWGHTHTADSRPGAQSAADTKHLFISQEGENSGRSGSSQPSSSLPEEHIPEEQPARVEAQSQQRVKQGAIDVVFQHALCQRCQEELPALRQGKRCLLQLPPQEQATQEDSCWARQHQQGSIEGPGGEAGSNWALRPVGQQAPVAEEARVRAKGHGPWGQGLASAYRGPEGLVSAAAGTMVAASRKPREKLVRVMQASCRARQIKATSFRAIQPLSGACVLTTLQGKELRGSMSREPLPGPAQPSSSPVGVVWKRQASCIDSQQRQHHGLGLSHGEVLGGHMLTQHRQEVEGQAHRLGDQQGRHKRGQPHTLQGTQALGDRPRGRGSPKDPPSTCQPRWSGSPPNNRSRGTVTCVGGKGGLDPAVPPASWGPTPASCSCIHSSRAWPGQGS